MKKILFLLPLFCTSCITFQEGDVPEHLTGRAPAVSSVMTFDKAQSAMENDLLIHLVRTGKTPCLIACGKGEIPVQLQKNLASSGMIVFCAGEKAGFLLNSFPGKDCLKMNLVTRDGKVFWEKTLFFSR